MIYEWKSNSRINTSPDVAADVFRQLENSGGLTPKRLVEVSKPNDAPLHNEFEWNDKKAAQQYREAQAGHLIRCLVVRKEESSEQTTRVYFPVSEPKVYTNITTILKNDNYRERMLEQAKREMISFKVKYKNLSELEPVFESIAKVTRGLEVVNRDAV